MIGVLTDIETGDLMIRDGSVVIENNTEQVAECVLIASQGEFKEFPVIGAEIVKMTNGNPNTMWCSKAEDMLKSCGVHVSRVYFKDDKIIIE